MSSEEDMGEEEEELMVGQMPTVMVPRHIKKRSLRNKALSISFDEKGLKDYVTGFHKRKKKRRKEAQKQLADQDRKMRIAARKKRKEEKEMALYGRILSPEERSSIAFASNGAGGGDSRENGDSLDVLSETKTYDDGAMRVVVTTSEISCEDDFDVAVKAPAVHVNTSALKNQRPKNSMLGVKKNPQKKFSHGKTTNKSRRSMPLNDKGKNSRKKR